MSRCNTKTISTTTASELTYCCLPEGVRLLYQNKADTYGEFAVNPGTGTIVRIVINADLNEERDPDAPLIRSQVMVEYGSEELPISARSEAWKFPAAAPSENFTSGAWYSPSTAILKP